VDGIQSLKMTSKTVTTSSYFTILTIVCPAQSFLAWRRVLWPRYDFQEKGLRVLSMGSGARATSFPSVKRIQFEKQTRKVCFQIMALEKNS
jgi:hypothetical protein